MIPEHFRTIHFIFERSCLRKKQLSEEEANVVVDIEASHGRLIYYYKCSFCNSHHMTSMVKEPEEHLIVI